MRGYQGSLRRRHSNITHKIIADYNRANEKGKALLIKISPQKDGEASNFTVDS